MRRVRGALLCALVLVGLLMGLRLWATDGARGFFYQTEFAPAFSIACGKGFRNIGGAKGDEVRAFLAGRGPVPTCDGVFTANPEMVEPNILQYQTISLQYAFGHLWKGLGVGWHAAGIVLGVLVALLAFAAYFLASQFLGFAPSLLIGLTGALAIGPLATYAVDIRDFSKAPFIVMLLGLFFAITFGDRARLMRLGLAAALVACIGIGFRSDVSLFLLLTPLAFLIRAIRADARASALTGLAIFALVCLAFNTLLLDFSHGLGRNFPHFVVLGHARQFLLHAGLIPSPQGAMTVYNDIYVHALVGMFTTGAGGQAPAYASLAYDEAGRRFLIELIKVFPANELTLAVSAAYRSLFPFLKASDSAALALLVIACFTAILSLRAKGALFVALAIALAGLTGVQFDPRHYLHVFILGLILVAILVATLMDAAGARVAGQRWAGMRPLLWAEPPAGYGWRPALVFAALCLSVPGILLLARGLQDRSVAAMVETIGRFPRQDLAYAETDGEAGTRNRVFDLTGVAAGGYFAMTFAGPSQCDFARTAITVDYAEDDAFFRWPFRMDLPAGEIRAAYFPAPVYPGRKGLSSATVSGLKPGCDIALARLAPDRAFVPFHYFDGLLAEPAHHRHPLMDGADLAVWRARRALGLEACAIDRIALAGNRPAERINHALTMPRAIVFDADPGPDGISSDHLDIGLGEITVDGRTFPLSTMRLETLSAPVFPVKRNLNILDKPLKIGSETIPHGFGAHAPSRFAVMLPEALRGKAGHLSFVAGIDAQTGGAGTVNLSVCLVK